MLGTFSFLSYDKLFINRIASPYCEILSLGFFYAWTSQAWSILQSLRLSISQYGPCIRLINSKYHMSNLVNKLRIKMFRIFTKNLPAVLKKDVFFMKLVHNHFPNVFC